MTRPPAATARRFSINAASSVVTATLQLGLLVCVNAYLVKRVTPDEYALLPLVSSLLIFGTFFQTLFTAGLARFIVEADARGQPSEITRIASSMLPILIAAALSIGAATLLVIIWIEPVLGISGPSVSEGRFMLAMLTIPLSLNIACAPYTVGLYVRQRFVTLNVIELGCELLRIVVVVALLFGVGTQVAWVVAGSAAAGIARVVVQVVATRRLLPEVRFDKREFSPTTARTLVRFGGYVSIGGITLLATNAIPVLLLAHVSNAVAVAAFHLGRLPDASIRHIMAAAVGPAQPILTSLHATGEQTKLRELYYRGGRYHMWASLLPAAVLAAFSESIVQLYAGSTYASAAMVLTAFVLTYPATCASAMFYRVAHANGRVGKYYVCDAVLLLGTLATMLYTVGIRGGGARGAAIAILLPSLVLHVILIWPAGLAMVQGNWHRFLSKTVVPGLIPFILAIGIGALYANFVELSSWARVGLGAVIATGLYVISMILCFDAADWSFVRQLRRTELKDASDGESSRSPTDVDVA